MIQLEDTSPGAKIKAVGIGGGGGNAVSWMMEAHIPGVELIAANTDVQVLENSPMKTKVQLGPELTKGLGAGANPEIGRRATEESADEIKELLAGADMVFITAGLGGGTGTGGAPVIARLAKEAGALAVGVVTKPFLFEGRRRMQQAEAGLKELESDIDSLIVIPNQKLLAFAGRQTSIREAFALANQVLLSAVRGIAELITVPGLINLDFADVRTIMTGRGRAVMGMGIAAGDNKSAEATEKAISSPLLESESVDGARGLLINITGGLEMTLFEVGEISSLVEEKAHPEANIIFGAVQSESMGDQLQVTIIATGFDDNKIVSKIETKPQTVDFKNYTEQIRERAALLQTEVPVASSTGHKIDRGDLDIPTFLRK